MYGSGKAFNINDYAPTDPMSQIPGYGYGNNQTASASSSSTVQQQTAMLAHTIPPLEPSHSQTSHRPEEQPGAKASRTESQQQTAKMRADYRAAVPYIPTPINGTSAVMGQPALASRPTGLPLPQQQHNNIGHRQQPGQPPNMIVAGQQLHPPVHQQPPRHPVPKPPHQSRGRQPNQIQRGNQGQAVVEHQPPPVQSPGSDHLDEEARRQQVHELRKHVDNLIVNLSEDEKARMHTFLDIGEPGIWLRFKGQTVDCIYMFEKLLQLGLPISDALRSRIPINHPERIRLEAARHGVPHGPAPEPPVSNVWSPEQVQRMQEINRMHFEANRFQHQVLMVQKGGRFQGTGPRDVQQMNQAQGPPHQNVAQGRDPLHQFPGQGPMSQNSHHGQAQMQPNQISNANFQIPPPNAFVPQHHQMARGPPPFLAPGVMQQNQQINPRFHPVFQMHMMNQNPAFMQQQQQGMSSNMQQALRDQRGGLPSLQNFQHPPNYILAQAHQYEINSQQQQRQPMQPPVNTARAMLTADQEPPRSALTPTPSDQVSSETTGDVPNSPDNTKTLVGRVTQTVATGIDQKPVVQPIQNAVVQNLEAPSKPAATNSSERTQKRRKQRKDPIPVITLDDDPPPRVKQEVPDDVVSSSSSTFPTNVKQEPATSSSRSRPPTGERMVPESVVNSLTEKYTSDMELMKTKHAELEEQIRHITKIISIRNQMPATTSAVDASNQATVHADEQTQEDVNLNVDIATVANNSELLAMNSSETMVAPDQGEVAMPSRSISPASVVPHKRKRCMISSDEEDDEDVPGPAPCPVSAEEHDEDVKPENLRIKEGRRARPRPRTFKEHSDDEMPASKSRRKKAAQHSDDDEDYQEEASSAGSENSGSPAPTDSEDSMADFVVPDDIDSDEESSSSREDRTTTRRRTPSREISRTARRSSRVSREKSDTPKSRKKPAPTNVGASSSNSKSKNVPKTEEEEEALQKLRKLKKISNRDEKGIRKNEARIKLLASTPIRRTRGSDRQVPKPQSPTTEALECTISAFTRHHSEQRGSSTQKEKSKSSEQRKREEAKRAKPDQSRRGTGTGNSSFQKRPTPSDDHSDTDGVHVPSKRMAHSQSVPGPSRIRPSPQVRRPGLSDIMTQRDKEQEERAKKEAANIERLRNKKYLTEEEKMTLRAAEKKTARSQQEGAQKRMDRSASVSSSSTSLKASTSTKRVTVKQEPVEVPEIKPDPPRILNPSLGRAFLSLRQKELERIFNTILDSNIADPAAEAQKIELDLVTQTSDQKKYSTRVVHKILEIRRSNASGIIEVNPNAVSHERMITGHAKENCTVTKGRKSVDFRQLGLDDLHQHIVPFKMTISELTVNAYPLFKPGSREVAIAETTYTANKKMFLSEHETTRTCSRCSKEFRVNPNGTMIPKKDACRYHNRSTVCDGKKQTYSKRYNCCNEEVNSSSASLGCKFSDIHVFDQLFERELGRFVATPKPTSSNDTRSKAAFALDCEMVYTLEGPALARLTMVDMKGNQVLDVFIKPPSTVIDANTEFSGLTLEQVNNATDDLKSCHKQLFKYVNSETILIGHSLESDLKAMRIVHTSVIDTAVMFAGANNKQALKNLSKKLLQKRIQGDNEDAVGHDSLEDAMTCVNLIFHGLKNPESVPHRKPS